jgi:hypothetical protein
MEWHPICTSRTFVKDGKRFFHYVMGHGADWDIEVTEVSAEEEAKGIATRMKKMVRKGKVKSSITSFD